MKQRFAPLLPGQRGLPAHWEPLAASRLCQNGRPDPQAGLCPCGHTAWSPQNRAPAHSARPPCAPPVARRTLSRPVTRSEPPSSQAPAARGLAPSTSPRRRRRDRWFSRVPRVPVPRGPLGALAGAVPSPRQVYPAPLAPDRVPDIRRARRPAPPCLSHRGKC